mmetsp:Transcript_26688/g.64659  ORF Transcript_26688/g.64659 Transcript_26688/m.64659 type:complete len:89 (-) Transcript_26688:93-359(-)
MRWRQHICYANDTVLAIKRNDQVTRTYPPVDIALALAKVKGYKTLLFCINNLDTKKELEDEERKILSKCLKLECNKQLDFKMLNVKMK